MAGLHSHDLVMNTHFWMEQVRLFNMPSLLVRLDTSLLRTLIMQR